jgi:hypothetical protein
MKDESVADTSPGSTRIDARRKRLIEAKFESRLEFLPRIGTECNQRFRRDDALQVPHPVADDVRKLLVFGDLHDCDEVMTAGD